MNISKYTNIEDQKISVNESVVWKRILFRNCEITFNISSHLLIAGDLYFEHTKLIFKKKFANYNWTDCFFNQCTFHGILTGNDFGNWPDYFVRDDKDRIGDIVNCDFSDSQLNGCRIIDSNPGSNKFPHWPSFTIHEPYKHIEELGAVSWPDKFSILIQILEDELGDKTKAITWNFKGISKYTSSDKLFDLLKQFPFIEL